MKLTSKDLFLLCQRAIFAAEQAGQLITSYNQQTIQAENKTGGSSLASQVVTEVDYLAQEIILKALLPTCGQFNLALLSEETPDNEERLEKDYFWCIDPLDGTLPFIESTPGYAVSIALVAKSGEAQIGVIYDPVKSTLYHAIKDQGAYKNNKPLHLSSSQEHFTLIADRSFKDLPHYSKLIRELKKIGISIGLAGFKSILHGSAAMNACWVLEHAPACYFKFPKPENGGGSLWDYAASACLFKETGAIACDIYSHPLDLNRADSTFMNHNGILYASDQTIAEAIRALVKNYCFQ